MNKRIILFFTLSVMTVFHSMAQEPSDSLLAKELQEVVIEAPRVVHKFDMDVYHPSKSAVGISKNGMQLLANLMIPTLSVNDVLGTVTAAGQSVQVRINGREASVTEVRNLLPETIKRVEWIDDPGLRYNGANYVLNFIVSNPTVGGSLMTSGRQALTTRFGTYNADLKLNSGKSQWSVGGFYKLTDNIKAYRDYYETFTYTDGHQLTRIEKPEGGSVSDHRGDGWVTYNYVKPDTTVFYVGLYGHRNISSKEQYSGMLSLSDGSDDLHLDNNSGSQGTTPSFSAYLEQNFAKKQMLVVDFSASLYMGHTFSGYQESLPGAAGYLTDITTYIKDRNQAYAAEADYIKKWNKSRLTAGVSYTANRNRSVYLNLDNRVFHQRQDKVYFFAEYYRQINKFALTAGMGMQYNDFNFRESGKGTSSWNMRPRATVAYSLNSRHKFRIRFSSWQSAPSLAQTNIAPQQIDGFQWNIGNPALKTSDSYMLSFRYSYSFPRVDGTFGIKAFTSPNAIAPYMEWEGDRLITSYENSQGHDVLTFNLSPQVEIIPGWLTASGTIEYRAERMKGTGYCLYNHNWSGNAQVMVMHKGFVLTCQYNKSSRQLFGEKISWNEDFSLIDISYNWKKWQFGAGMLMPFGKYDQGSRLLGKYNANEKHMRINLRIPYLSVSYNIQWGHQKRGTSKRINADASVDQSSTGSR